MELLACGCCGGSLSDQRLIPLAFPEIPRSALGCRAGAEVLEVRGSARSRIDNQSSRLIRLATALIFTHFASDDFVGISKEKAHLSEQFYTVLRVIGSMQPFRKLMQCLEYGLERGRLCLHGARKIYTSSAGMTVQGNL